MRQKRKTQFVFVSGIICGIIVSAGFLFSYVFFEERRNFELCDDGVQIKLDLNLRDAGETGEALEITSIENLMNSLQGISNEEKKQLRQIFISGFLIEVDLHRNKGEAHETLSFFVDQGEIVGPMYRTTSTMSVGKGENRK